MVVVFKYRKGCTRLNTNHQPLFRSNPLLSDSQPTSASWIRWIGYGWKHARSSSSVRHSRSCLSDLWHSQSNANPITVQCKEVTDSLFVQFKVTTWAPNYACKHINCTISRFKNVIFRHHYVIQKNSSCIETEQRYLCRGLHFNRQNWMLINPPND